MNQIDEQEALKIIESLEIPKEVADRMRERLDRALGGLLFRGEIAVLAFICWGMKRGTA